MVLLLPSVFMGSLLCAWFQCKIFPQVPFMHLSMENSQKLISTITGRDKLEDNIVRGPVVRTKQGLVEGFMGKNSEGRDIYKFTGIPYAESPSGHLRFRDPVLRKPWRHILKATSESPFCIQETIATLGMSRGQEDCLYLDIYTPKLPAPERKSDDPGLPVFIWIPAGAYIFGKSSFQGSAYLLNEDVIFVPINVRLGVLGYLATGDGASSGNWGLKDQLFAVQWVHDNIAAFGGDPKRIILGGLSSGSASAHAILFTNHPARKHIKGILGMSGSVFANHDLDGKGRALDASTVVAKAAGCPTAAEGKSWEMVECLREINPFILSAYQNIIYSEQPIMSQMLSPTIEPNVTNALITELPETLYEQGEVPPIPLILTRAEDETGFYQRAMRFGFLALRPVWYKWMPIFFKLAYRNTKLGEEVTEEQGRISLRKLNKFYLGRDRPPVFTEKRDFHNWLKMANDGMYNVPCWKALELHNKIAPTYSYVFRQQTFAADKMVRFLEDVFSRHYGAAHGADFFMLFNNTMLMPPMEPGSDFHLASKRLINIITNFAAYGKPLYRNPSGELLPVWKTIGDRNHMRVLDIGLVNNISMAWDPLPSTRRMRIWEEVKF